MGKEEPAHFGTGGIKTFVEHWGWIYIVYQMAEFYRESRNDQYQKGVVEFYNDMAFMKDHGEWKREIAEQQALENKLNG